MNGQVFDKLQGGVPVLTVIFFGTIAVAGILALLRTLQKRSAQKKAPVTKVRAKVCGKREDLRRGQTQNLLGFGQETLYFYATFQTEDGKTLELEVNEAQNHHISAGDEGLLVYKGTEFLSFDEK